MVSEQFLTDTALYADLVLPAATQLDNRHMFSWGHFYLTWNEPAISPLGQALSIRNCFDGWRKHWALDDPLFGAATRKSFETALDWTSAALEGITYCGPSSTRICPAEIGFPGSRAPHANGDFLTPPEVRVQILARRQRGSFVVPSFPSGYIADQAGTPVAGVPDFFPPREARSHAHVARRVTALA